MKAEQDYGRDGYMLEAMEMRRKVVLRHYTIANHDINFAQSFASPWFCAILTHGLFLFQTV